MTILPSSKPQASSRRMEKRGMASRLATQASTCVRKSCATDVDDPHSSSIDVADLPHGQIDVGARVSVLHSSCRCRAV